MRCSRLYRRQMRPYYNLPSKSDHGRKMTGFLTPYRHWMWKQNELWRNVHEAQFEHLRKVYKRQWLESFRVNADEYIYKYNITKAAQLAQWEYEMQEQEKKRVESKQMTEGRQALKKKHLDLLREFHERQFFFWYERASERLQSMSLIQYIPQSKLQEHIEKELDKYVAGKNEVYPLNFVGQMPLVEDHDGNIVEVPESLLVNHVSEHPDSTAKPHQPHESTSVSGEEQLLRTMASAREESLEEWLEDDSRALSETIDDISREEEQRDEGTRVARSMEETESEREISRRMYIDRGKTGSKAIFRRPSVTETGGSTASVAAGGGTSATGTNTPMRRRKKGKLDKVHVLQEQQDALLAKLSARSLKEGESASTLGKRGEIVTNRGRIRDKAAIPTKEILMQNPELAAGSVPNARVSVQDKVDQLYHRGRYKQKKGGEGDSNEDL
ncbi:hypothetical protein TraAM80_03071 [Trypanosoma rangeli]|uniref:Uncharacterized protein n=1 Tax=Trypanosoma rangeli TaxID=5698 RepID=A0A3R7NKQ1_TRYRA|nr:uncharacterized protein TraAM80_03071 [Trypanosoma rangeli]RNF07923.1 hypothetical protein TraAM80_03071 [Trypanosoma rangeli]|eukprot:RNF07923.1 hypothetical protein TraAM80_03071 [Trypanosoma rangeli]